MNTQVYNDIAHQVELNPTEEVCGFIYYGESNVDIFPCKNVSPECADSFEIDPNDYVSARQLGEICGIYHGGKTHTNDGFSECDLETANEIGLPFHAFCGPNKNLSCYIPPSYDIDPIGLPFIWGQWDCYETVRIHYRKLGITLPDYQRDRSFEKAAPDAITQYIQAEGFEYVNPSSPILKDDILLFKTNGLAHHLGVVTGPNKMIHHPLHRLSCFESLDGGWMRRLAGALRHKTKTK